MSFPSLPTMICMSETLRKGCQRLVQRVPTFCLMVPEASLLFLSFDNSHIHLPSVENASVTTIVLQQLTAL